MTRIITHITRCFRRLAGHGKDGVAAAKACNSHNEEERIAKELVTGLGFASGQCVDIAASDGLTISNTVGLYRRGWGGLAVEGHPVAFSKLAANYRELSDVQLARCMVTPANVVQLLHGHGIKTNFEFLNLDIDSYDYFVLEALLGHFRPAVICTEINEKIPPPIKFTVKWAPGHSWQGDHFFGQSIQTLHALASRFDYALVELHYNNAFLVANEFNPASSLTAAQAYDEGYRLKPDRRAKFPWNDNMEDILNVDPEKACKILEARFAEYSGRFEIGI